MAQYTIHKGVDRQVEFQGLTSHYLILFVAGLLGIFLLLSSSTPEGFRRASASSSPSRAAAASPGRPSI